MGAAYSLKMDKKDACAVTYIGDGGTSEVMAPLFLECFLPFTLLRFPIRFLIVDKFSREIFMQP